ncbi:hypothetical protein GCK72_019049 [Caenorhabditis remanei]|uniref:Uncharacterized protein n=1 Tax=Caenorhabditis remanei TaxID=31234 RepID=A0A6A5GCQ0_CAERE|nr:hypothetical protein GCK72_019049 [Caenorhabditis remanei]KAF1752494.1 hypothetical protein GCK72_019049 [Caenorhabditis remanei]
MSDPFAPQANDQQSYLAALEKRLKAVKDKKKIDSKSILKDIESLKNDQLFKLLSQPDKPTPIEEKFDDDFVPQDKPIKPSLLRQKVVPQTCAINKNELAHIVKYDLTQKLHEFYCQLDESVEDRQESQELLRELQELSNELEHQKLEEEVPEKEEKGAQTGNESEKCVKESLKESSEAF